MKPFWSAKNTEEASKLGPIPDFQTGQEYTKIPALKEFFFVVVRGYVFMIAVSEDPDNVKPLKSVLKQAMDTIPGAHGMASQRSIFGRGAGNSNAVEVELSCNDLERLKTSCTALMKKLQEEYTKFAVRSKPENFDEAGPERRIMVDQVKAKDLGLSVESIATAARGLVDGAFVGDFNFEGDNIDLVVIRDPALLMTPDELPDQPVAVRETNGRAVVLPLGEVVNFIEGEASQSIRRVEQQRAIEFTVSPPPDVALEEAQERIFELIRETRTEGDMPDDVHVSLSGNADRLTQVRQALLGKWTGWNRESLLSVGLSRFFLALVITYLLMSALFESFVYPIVILLSVPMATVGGFAGLAWVHAVDPTQQLDVLTMLGFIILIGVVVNNAILIVHQALNFMRGYGEAEEDIVDPLPPAEAIRESVKTRIRPIFMTTATSVCGMLPLVVSPGAGSELYRGLGSVVVGGLVCSTIFTLVVVPLLLSLVIDLGVGVKRLFRRSS